MKMILQKAIAASGYCSRRKADELIRAGFVRVNGEMATIGDQADPEKDNITIKGKGLPGPEKKIYIKLNKPLGYTCTNKSFKDEKNIFDLVNIPERLFAVGRLDKDSHGLILLTNDGDLAQRLAHPRFQHEKMYEVKVREEVKNPQAVMNKLIKGIDIGEGDGTARIKSVKYLQDRIFIITLTEGKKRQIRRMFDWLGLRVIDLERIGLAGLGIGILKDGAWVYLSKEEIEKLQRLTEKDDQPKRRLGKRA
jgi:pseudouridine synthase